MCAAIFSSMRSTNPIDLLYIFIMLGWSISTRLFCFLQNLVTDWIGSFPANIGSIYNCFIFPPNSCYVWRNISYSIDVPQQFFAILSKSGNGAFYTRVTITVQVVAICFELKCCRNSGLVKNCPLLYGSLSHQHYVKCLLNVLQLMHRVLNNVSNSSKMVSLPAYGQNWLQ